MKKDPSKNSSPRYIKRVCMSIRQISIEQLYINSLFIDI